MWGVVEVYYEKPMCTGTNARIPFSRGFQSWDIHLFRSAALAKIRWRNRPRSEMGNNLLPFWYVRWEIIFFLCGIIYHRDGNCRSFLDHQFRGDTQRGVPLSQNSEGWRAWSGTRDRWRHVSPWGPIGAS